MNYRRRTHYAISFLMVVYSVLYVALYLLVLPSRIGIIINAAAAVLYSASIILVAGQRENTAKLLQLCIFVPHVLAVSFVFSARAGYHFYFILLPVIAFLFFEFDGLREKLVTVVFTIIAIASFTVCEVFATEVHSPGISTEVFRILFYTDVALIMIGLFVALWIFSVTLKRVESQLVLLSTTDALTGAHNRRYFIQHAEIEMARSHRYKHPLAILMIDVDHFKKINDSYGHHEGDKVLKAVVVSCQECVRCTDLFSRVGGEEFAALLVDAKPKDAITIARRIHHSIADLTVPGEKQDIRLTVSIGLAFHGDGDDNLDDLLRQADAQLYRAKENGRNRVEFADGALPSLSG